MKTDMKRRFGSQLTPQQQAHSLAAVGNQLFLLLLNGQIRFMMNTNSWYTTHGNVGNRVPQAGGAELNPVSGERWTMVEAAVLQVCIQKDFPYRRFRRTFRFVCPEPVLAEPSLFIQTLSNTGFGRLAGSAQTPGAISDARAGPRQPRRAAGAASAAPGDLGLSRHGARNASFRQVFLSFILSLPWQIIAFA
jgi:hypothetical protein